MKHFSKHITNHLENIHQSFNEYVLGTYHAPGTVLGIGDTIKNTTDNPQPPWGLQSSGWRLTINETNQ